MSSFTLKSSHLGQELCECASGLTNFSGSFNIAGLITEAAPFQV